MTPVADNSLRQAAVLIRSLGPEAAAAMLGRLSAEEARALRTAIHELGEIDEGERMRVADQLRQPEANAAESDAAPVAPASTVSEDGAVELQLGTSTPAPEPPAAPRSQPAPVEKPLIDGGAWLRSLGDANPILIATYLSEEQPRAMAVVLGYLPPDLSAGVLQHLPAEQRSRVVAQLAEQGDADPDSLRVIANGLSDWLDRHQAEQTRRESRVATIRKILAATPARDREDILRGLTKTEPEMAASLGVTLSPPAATTPPTTPPTTPAAPAAVSKPSAPSIPFAEMDRLDGRALAEAVGKLDSRTALLALAAAPESLVRQLTRGLPRAAAADLRSRLHRVGPTTLAEIDRAQEALSAATGQVVASRRAKRLATSTQGA